MLAITFVLLGQAAFTNTITTTTDTTTTTTVVTPTDNNNSKQVTLPKSTIPLRFKHSVSKEELSRTYFIRPSY